MKKLKSLFLLIVALFMLNSVAFAGAQDFVIVNYSGKTMVTLNISPSDSKSWGANRLSSNLAHGSSRKFTFDNYTERFFDIRAIFSDDTKWQWKGVDLGKVYKMVIDGVGTAHYN